MRDAHVWIPASDAAFTAFVLRFDATCRSGSDPEPTPGAALLSAVITYVQNEVGSLSPPLSESHAADLSPAAASATHSASMVVFPKLAGAQIRVSFDSSPRASRSLRRGRATSARRSRGTCSLVPTRPEHCSSEDHAKHRRSGVVGVVHDDGDLHPAVDVELGEQA